MTTFDKREEGFEKQFAHDEELKFKATARRNKPITAVFEFGMIHDERFPEFERRLDEAFRKAADLLQEHGHDVDFTDMCRNWARYLRRSGRDSEALDVLDQAAQVNASSRTRTLS